jgi:hypothetical protein
MVDPVVNVVPRDPEILHVSLHGEGRALCDGQELSDTLTSESPECRGMYACPTCHQLLLHFQRQQGMRRG